MENKNILDKNSLSRLAVAFFERDPKFKEMGSDAFFQIEKMLSSYTLRILCNDEIRTSASLQAAVVTAINTGKRCFKGGVTVVLPDDVIPLIRWPKSPSLKAICNDLGAEVKRDEDGNTYSVTIEIGQSTSQSNWRVLANDWTGAVVPPEIDCPYLPGDKNFPLGGILAGSLVVAISFLKYSGFEKTLGTRAIGLSLWRPDIDWTLPEAQGPLPKYFPDKLWLLGLGHLGQAYTWCLGLLPFEKPNDFLVKLQDDDKAVKGNKDSGLLCEADSAGRYKTRLSSEWLEDRGISTRMVERKYDDQYYRLHEDPEILLGGLDKLAVRKVLKTNEFKLVVDCGLGAGLNFDTIRVNTFPNIGMTPGELWKDAVEAEATPALKEYSQKMVGCGFTVGIATSFVGCISGCLAISEILRSYNQGAKFTSLYCTVRELPDVEFGNLGTYKTETLSGFTSFE